jgi:hypothetical protein
MPSRFDPTTPLQSTPPFVRWTLAVGCPLRELDDYFDPERTDRLLRGVRCYSDAVAEGRVMNGTVVQRGPISSESLGFDIDGILTPLGGEAFVRGLCADCPANALERSEPTALAGCVGLLVPPAEDTDLWSSLAMTERPAPDDLKTQRERLTGQSGLGINDYLLAIDAALEHNLPLITRAFPGGRCEGRRWYVDAHCGRCKSTWPEAKRQQCRVCGQLGGRQEERRRMRIGTRPYRPLREFLTSEQIAQLVG